MDEAEITTSSRRRRAPRRTPGRRVLHVVWVAVSVLAGVAAGLIVTRVAVETLLYHPTGRIAHPELGPVYRSGIDVHGMEGFAWSRIGADGIREPLFASRADANASVKVLCLGDSYTEAFQMRYASTFPAVLEDGLGAALGESVVAVNAGMSGASPAKYIGAAEYYQRRFRPDVVVIQVTENDFGPDLFAPGFSHHVVGSSGSYRVEPGRWSENPKAVGAQPERAWYERLAGEGATWVARDLLAKRAASAAAAETVPSAPAASTAAPADQHPGVIDWVAEQIAAAYDVPVVMLYLPTAGDPYPLREPSANEAALEAACEEHGLGFVSARGPYADRFDATGAAAHGFANTRPGTGHINERGHEVVAGLLVPAVSAALRSTR